MNNAFRTIDVFASVRDWRSFVKAASRRESVPGARGGRRGGGAEEGRRVLSLCRGMVRIEVEVEEEEGGVGRDEEDVEEEEIGFAETDDEADVEDAVDFLGIIETRDLVGGGGGESGDVARFCLRGIVFVYVVDEEEVDDFCCFVSRLSNFFNCLNTVSRAVLRLSSLSSSSVDSSSYLSFFCLTLRCRFSPLSFLSSSFALFSLAILAFLICSSFEKREVT